MNPLPKLRPGADLVFRRLFNEDHGCRLLISLLNAILGYPEGRRIRRLKLLRAHVAGALHGDKEVVLDVRAEGEDGRIFHIEVQVCLNACYRERILFYWAGMYSGQIATGEGYSDLRAVTSVHILFFTLFKAREHAGFHHVFRARADGDNAILSPQMEIHTIELPKLPDLPEGQDCPKGQKWLYWLKHGDEMTQEEVQRLGVPEIMEAERKLELISQDRELRIEYERRRMAHHDAVSLTRDSRYEGLREGKKETLAEAIVDMCELLGLPVSPQQKAKVDGMDLAELEKLRLHLKQTRSWPTS